LCYCCKTLPSSSISLFRILVERGNCNKVQLAGSSTGRYLIKIEKARYTTNDLSLDVSINLAYSSNPYYTGTQTSLSSIQDKI